MKPDYIIFLGAFISILGASLAAFGTLKKSKAASKKQEELQAKIDSLHVQNSKLKDYTTGGDSYPKMEIYHGGDDAFYVFIQCVGKNPLSEVQFTYRDMNGWSKLTNIEASQHLIESKRNIIKIGYVRPGNPNTWEGKPFKFDKRIGVYLIIDFFANNGSSTEIIRAKYVKGNWLVAYKIIRGLDQDVIYEIPEGYPALPNKDDTFNKEY